LAIDVHLLAPRLSPVRRASTSIASNTAEGAGRGSDAERANFLRYAYLKRSKGQAAVPSPVPSAPQLTPSPRRPQRIEYDRHINNLLSNRPRDRREHPRRRKPHPYQRQPEPHPNRLPRDRE